jgi:filamentous hemagglutinin
MHNAMKHIFIAFLVGLILCPPSMVHAGGITPDAAAQASNRPTMDAAQNGVPVVNIAAPNSGGLSHNKFSDFNVDHQGVIFNNATALGVSQLGGTLMPNANLGGRAASSILTEVTGTGRTSIGGYIEIFGSRANFILANPNGISINGGGFINTPKATLATGRPQFDNNHFLGIDVRDGDILVEGDGVNATNIDAFELITRVASINAVIYANKLKVVTGQNRYDPATETIVPLAPDGSPAPAVSIDSTALGGMYAGRIELVGTEAGVGVNTQGIVQATQNLVMTADGKLQVKNTASSGDLALTSENGEVAVSGTVQAVGTADLTGKTVTVAKVEDTDTPLVKGGAVEVHAETLTNSGLIAADDTLSVESVFLENTGTLYSGGSGLFRIVDTLHNDQGIILSKGDMVLEGTVGGTRMATLQNDSGNIESLDGGLVFRAETFANNNSHFSLVPGATESSYAEGGFWHYGDEGDNCYRLFNDLFGAPRVAVRNNANRIAEAALAVVGLDTSRDIFSIEELQAAVAATEAELAADPNYLTADQMPAFDSARAVAASGRLYVGKIVGRTDGVIFQAVTTRDSATGQDLGATIAAQGDIRIEAGDARNVVSRISSATGDIVINADSFDNEGQGIYERTSVGWGRGIFHNHESPDRILTGSGTEVLLKPIDYAYGTLDAGDRVLISSGAVTNGVTEHNGIYSLPDPATQQQKVADVTTLTDGLPQNGLFQENTNPAHNYRIETNPALTNLDTFYGSDYALAHMGFNPNEEAYKRLGDKFYETRLVREQIFALTGKRFLEAARTTDTDQFLALMDNAVQAHTDLGLTVGIALTAEQVAALTGDIVWFEYQEVDGEQLLVPVVYLCPASLDKIAQGGAVIAAGEVQVDTTGNTANAGLIASRGQVTINADNFFNNKGTLAGQGVTVAAADSIYNTGGDISGTDVALKADNNVVLAADTVGFSGKGSSYTRIAKAGKISATGDLTVEAGKDVGVLGTELEAGGDATLKADGNLAVSTMETTFKHRLSGSNYNTRTDSTYNHGSSVKAGGALTLEAGENVAVHGSELESGGDAALKAGGNVSITAATDSTDFYSHNQGGSGGFFGGKKSTTIAANTQTAVASAVKSGGSLSVEAGAADADGDLSVLGSELSAEGDVDLKAADEILVVSAQEKHYRKEEATHSGFMGTGSMELGEHNGVATVRSEIEGGGKVALKAEGDITLQAASIKSGDETEITSTDGQVAMLVAKDSEYERKIESGTGFFSWSSSDEGTNDETVQHTKINAAKGLTITTAEGVVVQYKETGNVQEDIAQLAQAPGLEWMAEIADRDDVDWRAVQEVHEHWKKTDSGIGGPGMQLVSLAMAVALSFTPGGQGFATSVLGMASDSAMTAAVAAGFNSLVMQAGMQVVGNGGDIGAALQALASMDTVRALATAMLTAGLMEGISDTDFMKEFVGDGAAKGATGMDKFIANLAQKLRQNAIQAGVSTGVGTAINGGNLGENLLANMRAAAVSTLGAELAHEIGEAYDHGNGDLDYVSHKIAHAALGGAMDLAMGGDGVSGAIGGVTGEITGEILADQVEDAMLNGYISPVQAKQWLDAGVDLSKLSAGLAAAVAGKDFSAAANSGGNAARNNAAAEAAGMAAFFTANPELLPILVVVVGCTYALTPEEQKQQLKTAIAEGVGAVKETISGWIGMLSDEDRQQVDKMPGLEQALGVDTSLEGSPSDTDVDTGPITTPENGEGSDSGTVTEDQGGKVDDSGVITQGETPPNQMDQQRKRGQAPSSVTRVDKGKVPGEKNHVHFDDGSAINSDGTWKHGGRQLTNKEKKWLTDNGWKVPNE